MPKRLHDALERSAKKKGLKGDRKDRYVYGGMKNAAKKGGGTKTGR